MERVINPFTYPLNLSTTNVVLEHNLYCFFHALSSRPLMLGPPLGFGLVFRAGGLFVPLRSLRGLQLSCGVRRWLCVGVLGYGFRGNVPPEAPPLSHV